MDAKEMQKSVMQQADAMGVELTLQSEDVMLYLNKAVDQFVKDHFEPRANKLGLGFEQSIKRIEDLRDLVTTSTVDTSYESYKLLDYHIDKADIPQDNFLLISASFEIYFNDDGISFTVTNDKRESNSEDIQGEDYEIMRSKAKFIQQDDIYATLSDPFNKPRLDTLTFTINDNNIFVYTDDRFFVDKAIITYLKKPQTISVENETDCDLSETTHEDIVDLATRMLLKDKRQFQTNKINET